MLPFGFGLPTLAAASAEGPDQGRSSAEFSARLGRYVELRKQQEAKLPPLKKDETDVRRIKAHGDALAAAIRAARPEARVGDVFCAEDKALFLDVLTGELRGPGTAAARETIKVGNPKSPGTAAAAAAPVVLEVNALYPEGAPVSTVPPPLLAKLPALTADVQYRFVGRHLILLDTRAQIIIDYIADAAP